MNLRGLRAASAHGAARAEGRRFARIVRPLLPAPGLGLSLRNSLLLFVAVLLLTGGATLAQYQPNYPPQNYPGNQFQNRPAPPQYPPGYGQPNYGQPNYAPGGYANPQYNQPQRPLQPMMPVNPPANYNYGQPIRLADRPNNSAAGGYAPSTGSVMPVTAPRTNTGVAPADFGVWSLLPPLVAIVLAAVSRRVTVALMLGIFVGALIVNYRPLPHEPMEDISGLGGWLAGSIVATFETYLWGALKIDGHLRVFLFTLLMGAMTGLLCRAAAMRGLIELLTPLARTPRGGQIVGWLLGLMIFFDDYVNTIVLGNTLRPMTDRLKVSRAKLSFLVDSTSGPVAGLALVSTWVAYEVGLIAEGLSGAGVQESAYGIFLETIPYRFYVLWMLAFVVLVAIFGRDFGPMLAAERNARDGDIGSLGVEEAGDLDPRQKTPSRWYNAVIPVLTVVLTFFVLLFITGMRRLKGAPAEEQTFVEYLNHGVPLVSLLYASIAGVVVAVFLVRRQNLLSPSDVSLALAGGARTMLPGLVILMLAWGLNGVVEDLGTGDYLATLLKGSKHAAATASLAPGATAEIGPRINPQWMPTIVFLLAAGISFATGTSWTTMTIMVPVSMTVMFELAGPGPLEPLERQQLIATIASVLAGAIFGGHCSPISDTTALSSQAAACDHMVHVRTQTPYGIAVALVSIFCGTLPAGFGAPKWILLPIGPAVLLVVLMLVGRSVVSAAKAAEGEKSEKNSETTPQQQPQQQQRVPQQMQGQMRRAA